MCKKPFFKGVSAKADANLRRRFWYFLAAVLELLHLRASCLSVIIFLNCLYIIGVFITVAISD
jgi:hypothetical protein